jgi:hypothetical protein
LARRIILDTPSEEGQGIIEKFIIQILGRTLPTNHRLNLVHSKTYREKSCLLCQADDESIEHIFFQCSHFHDSRVAIKNECIKISFDAISKIDTKGMRHVASKPDLATIAEQITKFLFLPGDLLPEDYRMLSAGQIRCLFQEWLNSFITDQKTILTCRQNDTRAFDFLLPKDLEVSMLQQ